MIVKGLINRLQLLIRDARCAGLSIGTSELEDALKSLREVAPEEWDLTTILTTTMVKSKEEQKLFRQLLRLHLGLGDSFSESRLEMTNTNAGTDCCNGSGTGKGHGGVGGSNDNLAVLHALIRANDTRSKKAFIGNVLDTMETDLDWNQPDQRLINQVMLALNYREARYYLRRERPDDPETEAAIQDFEIQLADEIEYKKLEKADNRQREAYLASKNIEQVDFDQLSFEQGRHVEKSVLKFGKKLANKCSLRYRRARKGKIDFRQTIRWACGTGGTPLRLSYRVRKEDKPNLVILCDLSGSVAPYARFILLLLYELQRLFAQVRTFAFVDSVTEITGILTHSSTTTQAIRAILADPVYNKTGFSHYGTVIHEFSSKYINVGSKGQKLIVIGDARSNYQNVHQDLWYTVFRSYQQVFWLNPLPKAQWNTDDCLAEQIFCPIVTAMYECRNLHQLERVAKEIV